MQEKPSTYLDPSRHWCRAMNTLCLPEAHGRDVGTPGGGQAIKRSSFLGLKPLGAQQPPEPDMGVQHDLHHRITDHKADGETEGQKTDPVALQVAPGASSGSLTIRFADLDQLDLLCSKLGVA